MGFANDAVNVLGADRDQPVGRLNLFIKVFAAGAAAQNDQYIIRHAVFGQRKLCHARQTFADPAVRLPTVIPGVAAAAKFYRTLEHLIFLEREGETDKIGTLENAKSAYIGLENWKLVDASDLLSQRLLHFHVGLASDHDALCLRRTSTMHGLRQIADSSSTHGHVFDQAQDTHAVFGRHAVDAAEVLVNVLMQFRMTVVCLGRQGNHRAASQILCQTSDVIREAGNVLLADVGEQQVDQVVARLGLGALRASTIISRIRWKTE